MMKTPAENPLTVSREWTARKPYAKPEVKRVDLALAETLSIACKLEYEQTCIGPPIRAFDGGS